MTKAKAYTVFHQERLGDRPLKDTGMLKSSILKKEAWNVLDAAVAKAAQKLGQQMATKMKQMTNPLKPTAKQVKELDESEYINLMNMGGVYFRMKEFKPFPVEVDQSEPHEQGAPYLIKPPTFDVDVMYGTKDHNKILGMMSDNFPIILSLQGKNFVKGSGFVKQIKPGECTTRRMSATLTVTMSGETTVGNY